MVKANAYSQFVKAIYLKRKSEGDNTPMNRLYGQLDKEWRSLDEKEREFYKEKAKRINEANSDPANSNERSNANQHEPTKSFRSENPRPHQSGLGPIAAIKCETKYHIKDSPDVKPDVKFFTKKRPHEEDEEKEESSDWTVAVAQVKKFRPGIPKFRDVKDILDSDKLRYKDYYLVEIRQMLMDSMLDADATIGHRPICTVSMNILSRHKVNETHVYVPIEVGMFKYSIRDGALGEAYHCIINSGPPPTGTMTKALDHSKTHKIPFQQYPKCARTDYAQIYKEITKYSMDSEMIVCVEEPQQIEQVKGGLDWLYKKAMEEFGDSKKLKAPSLWTIVPVIEYVAAVYQYCHVNILNNPHYKFGVHYYLRHQLMTQTTLDFNEPLMCKFHREGGDATLTQYCAESCARRTISKIQGTLEVIYRMFVIALGDEFKRD